MNKKSADPAALGLKKAAKTSRRLLAADKRH
jgi:hypothetical protein